MLARLLFDKGSTDRTLTKSNLNELKKIKAEMRTKNKKSPSATGGTVPRPEDVVSQKVAKTPQPKAVGLIRQETAEKHQPLRLRTLIAYLEIRS